MCVEIALERVARNAAVGQVAHTGLTVFAIHCVLSVDASVIIWIMWAPPGRTRPSARRVESGVPLHCAWPALGETHTASHSFASMASIRSTMKHVGSAFVEIVLARVGLNVALCQVMPGASILLDMYNVATSYAPAVTWRALAALGQP